MKLYSDVLESYLIEDEWIECLESILLHLTADSATEATVSSGSANPTKVTSKFTSSMQKFKQGKKDKDEALMKEAKDEMNEANNELKAEMKNAKTPEEKKKWSKALKAGLIAAGAIVGIIGARAASKKLAARAASNNARLEDLNKAVNATTKVMSNTISGATANANANFEEEKEIQKKIDKNLDEINRLAAEILNGNPKNVPDSLKDEVGQMTNQMGGNKDSISQSIYKSSEALKDLVKTSKESSEKTKANLERMKKSGERLSKLKF